MRLKLLVHSLGVISVLGLSACAKYDFSPADPVGTTLSENPGDNTPVIPMPTPAPSPTPNNPPVVIKDPTILLINSTQMKLGSSSASFDQDVLSENRTVVSFQVTSSSGGYVNDLTSSSLTLKENGITVPTFSMTSNPSEYRQTVDIAFLFDITCSMKPTIASAKTRVIDFINTSRAAGYHTRMCLSTFGDYTVRKCDRFYDNDPSNPSTVSEVNELISEVNKLAAGCGSADPGGADLDENPMRAIIDAEAAPWATGSQRFGILITDAGFLYSPGNSGAMGSVAPKYTDVLASLKRSQMNIFGAVPSLGGYNKNFGTSQGVIPASNGEYFPYSSLVSGAITLNTILNRIISRVQTTYALEYVADDVIGLNPTLPLTQRTLTVTLKDGSVGTVKIVGTTSNLPTGRADYKKVFKLSDKTVDPTSLSVHVNGVAVNSGFALSGGTLTFASAPAKGAKIEVDYAYAAIVDALQTSPVLLAGTEDTSALAVFLNGVKATSSQVTFEKNLEGHLLAVLNSAVFSEADPYQIRAHGGLTVEVYRIEQ